MYVCVYICIYRERERNRYVYTHSYKYIYIYIYIYLQRRPPSGAPRRRGCSRTLRSSASLLRVLGLIIQISYFYDVMYIVGWGGFGGVV